MKGLWAFLVRALFVAMLSVAVVGAVGCGDDSDGGGDGDGDTGDGDTGDGDTGDGDSGDGDAGDGDSGDGDGDSCVDGAFDGITAECAACACDACEADVVSACDEGCWALISCVGASGCADGDTACIIPACMEFIGSATPATAVGDCAFPAGEAGCTEECGGGGDGDGDADGGAGDDAGL